MMKKFFVAVFLFFMAMDALAQPGNDSAAYQSESNKINTMLLQRRQKFGQYDESLGKHSGIFGMQTKNDIRRSNDILMDIVKTDDSIYREIKVLLDFKTYPQTPVPAPTRARTVQKSAVADTSTANNLKSEVEQLKAEINKQQQDGDTTKWVFIISLAVALFVILLLAVRKRKSAG